MHIGRLTERASGNTFAGAKNRIEYGLARAKIQTEMP